MCRTGLIKSLSSWMAWEKNIVNNRTGRTNVKRSMQWGMHFSTVAYGSKLWSVKATVRQKVYLFEKKCARSMAGVN